MSTNDRRKIQNKIREGKKKKAKAVTKNTQWKSKHKKDPGIPNNYPYKEQVLAEIEQQRRLAAEDKEKRKALKKAAKAEGQANGHDDDDELEGVSSLHAKRIHSKVLERPQASEEPEIEIEDAPILFNHDLPTLQAVLDAADVIIQVLDGRDPFSFRSAHLEDSVAKTKLVLLLNKIDCCPQQAVAGWLSELRRNYPTFAFRSASAFLPTPVNEKSKGKDPVNDSVGAQKILTYLSELAAGKKEEGDFTVAVVGLTNVGKSSFINSLLEATTLSVYTLSSSSRGPSTTEFPQEVYLSSKEGKKIRFIDTPGFLWENNSENPPSMRVKDMLLRNRGRIDRVKDPMPLIEYIVTHSSAEDLMLFYNLPAFSKDDVDAFISGVARSQQLVKKRGVLDLAAACRNVLRDWNTGKLKWFTMPMAPAPSSEEDNEIISALPSRKELRMKGGLVKFTAGEREARKVLLDQPYQSADSDDSDADSEPDGDTGEEQYSDNFGEDSKDEGHGAGDQDETEENEDEEDEQPVREVIPAKKRKRAAQDSLPPAKKVSFAPPKAKTKSRTTKSATDRKPANIPSAASKKDVKLGDDAYDFGKFF